MTPPGTEAAGGHGDRPTVVYDDDCGFCTWSVEFAARRGEFELVGFSELTPARRDRLPDDYERCVHLLVGDDVYSCGEATERALADLYPWLAPVFARLRRVPGYPRVRERCYRLVADHRDWFGRVWSRSPPARRS